MCFLQQAKYKKEKAKFDLLKRDYRNTTEAMQKSWGVRAHDAPDDKNTLTAYKKKKAKIASSTKPVKDIPCKEPEEGDEEENRSDTSKWSIANHSLEDGVAWFEVDSHDTKAKERLFWGIATNMVKDGLGDLVAAYIAENCNHSPWQEIVGKIKKVGKNPEVGKKKEPKKLEICHHERFEPDITYKAESNAGFCNVGRYLHGVVCGGKNCGVQFVATRNSKLGVRPDQKNPVYCCVFMEGQTSKAARGCRHAICAGCFKKGLLLVPDTNGRQRRKR